MSYMTISFLVLAISFALIGFRLFIWPRLDNSPPDTTGAMWAWLMTNPETKGDWEVDERPKVDEFTVTNQKINARVRWHWYDGITTDFPLTSDECVKLKAAMFRLRDEDRERRRIAAMERQSEVIERQYLGRNN